MFKTDLVVEKYGENVHVVEGSTAIGKFCQFCQDTEFHKMVKQATPAKQAEHLKAVQALICTPKHLQAHYQHLRKAEPYDYTTLMIVQSLTLPDNNNIALFQDVSALMKHLLHGENIKIKTEPNRVYHVDSEDESEDEPKLQTEAIIKKPVKLTLTRENETQWVLLTLDDGLKSAPGGLDFVYQSDTEGPLDVFDCNIFYYRYGVNRIFRKDTTELDITAKTKAVYLKNMIALANALVEMLFARFAAGGTQASFTDRACMV